MAARDRAPEVDDVLTTMPGWAARGLLYTIAAFVAALLVWANFSQTDVSVSGRGKIEHGIVEVTVLNQDIGLIEPKLPAHLKIDAYPFQEYGVVSAKVTDVARAGDDYKVTLVPERTTIPVKGRDLQLRDGLALTADIVTERVTLLSVLLRPFQKSSGAD